MTEISRPWTSTTPGDAGAYSQDNWALLQRYLCGGDGNNPDSGPITGSGVAPDPGLTVTQRGAGANMSVDVSAGAALVNGTFYNNDATVNLVIAANASGNPRVDVIVLNKDWSAQTIRLQVVQGTPAGSPVPKSMVQTPLVQWQIPLYDVAVANGAVSITNANISPHKSPANVADGVYLQGILNNSGVVLHQGDVVVWDTTADRAVTLTTVANDPLTAGVWVGRTAIGGYGRLQIRGIGLVNVGAAVSARGLFLSTSTVAAQAGVKPAGVQNANSIGYSLAITAGAGFCLAFINVQRHVGRNVSNVRNNSGGNFTTTSATLVNVSTTNARVTLTVQNGQAKITFIFMASTGSTQNVWFDIIVDGTTRLFGGNWVWNRANVFDQGGVVIEGIFTGLSEGSHTFDLQYAINSAATLTVYNTVTSIICIGEEI